VLAATDFSTTGDQAVAWAYAALPAGGTLRLIHVSPPVDTYATAVARPGSKRISAADHRRRVNEAREKLTSLIPPGSADRGVQTEVDVLLDRDPARAIGADARRFGADLLCLGSRGQGRLAEALLGSVAKSVMAETDQPVLLVRPMPL
jgi:nucleotide-binding universal stress UspA family protein